MLAEYIHTKSPKAKGWSYRTIYKMVQFFDTYSSENFRNIVNHYGMQGILPEKGQDELTAKDEAIVPIQLAQLQEDGFVPIESAQIPSVLFSTGWSNHQLIMSQCRTDEQRLFYMLYAGREQLEYKELQRAFTWKYSAQSCRVLQIPKKVVIKVKGEWQLLK